MPTLPKTPSLPDFQTYIVEMETERGFITQNIVQKCLLLSEEVGELCKAIRHQDGMIVDAALKETHAAHECADVLMILLSIANRLNIDLEQAFREKEALNKTRSWTKEKPPIAC